MARKVLNRKALREEAEAAEKSGAAKKKKKTAAAKKTATKKPARKSRKKKEAAEVRVKVFWEVYNQSMKRVARYEFNQKRQAQKKADELSKDGKTPHFIQKVKEAVQE